MHLDLLHLNMSVLPCVNCIPKSNSPVTTTRKHESWASLRKYGSLDSWRAVSSNNSSISPPSRMSVKVLTALSIIQLHLLLTWRSTFSPDPDVLNKPSVSRAEMQARANGSISNTLLNVGDPEGDARVPPETWDSDMTRCHSLNNCKLA